MFSENSMLSRWEVQQPRDGAHPRASWCTGRQVPDASDQSLGLPSGDLSHHFSSPLTLRPLSIFPLTWLQVISTAHCSSHLAFFCWQRHTPSTLPGTFLSVWRDRQVCPRSATRSSPRHMLWSINSYLERPSFHIKSGLMHFPAYHLI